MKTLEDEQYVVINAYKFPVFEIWRDFNVLSYIACPRYPYIRVYRLYDYVHITQFSSLYFDNPEMLHLQCRGGFHAGPGPH